MSQPASPKDEYSTPPSPTRVRYFLFVFLVSIFFLGVILWPFWSILVLSFLLSSLFRPIYAFFCKKLPQSIASVLTCCLITIIVFVPLLFFIGALSSEALNLYHWGRDTRIGEKLQQFLQESPLIAQAQLYIRDTGFDFEPTQITDSLTYLAKKGGLLLYNQASGWAADIMQFIVLFFMMILVIFFLLIDQPKLIRFLIKISPLPDDEDKLLLDRFEEIANAILKGNGICGIIQGILGGAMFSIMGLNSPILWGGVMAVLAFLPIFGIGLVMIPAALILAFNGQVGAGIFLFVFYLLLSLSMEYAIKPKMVGDQVKMHTLLVFLSLIGGLSVFGILGIIYGPLIITAFLTLSDIYLERYDIHVRDMS